MYFIVSINTVKRSLSSFHGVENLKLSTPWFVAQERIIPPVFCGVLGVFWLRKISNFLSYLLSNPSDVYQACHNLLVPSTALPLHESFERINGSQAITVLSWLIFCLLQLFCSRELIRGNCVCTSCVTHAVLICSEQLYLTPECSSLLSYDTALASRTNQSCSHAVLPRDRAL